MILISLGTRISCTAKSTGTFTSGALPFPAYICYSNSTLAITSPTNPRFIDHDDKVSESRLGDAYDLTARAWMARFKVPYSQCGCHQGDLSSIDGGLAAAIPDKLKFWNKGESKSDQRRRAIEKVIQGECLDRLCCSNG